jgi:glycosyltransferase involved in cell wall biosynthesis
MSKEANDNAEMLIRLSDRGVKLAVIAGTSSALKGSGKLPEFENMGSIPIYRLYKDLYEMFMFPRKKLDELLEIADKFKPDLIFCSQELNMRLALAIQSKINKPIVLLVEDAGRISKGEFYNSIKMKAIFRYFGIPTSGPSFWSWLCEKSAALITCHPRDALSLTKLSLHNKPVFYLPWPSFVLEGEESTEKENNTGIYVGSLYPFKNTQEFETTIPLILEKTDTQKFTIIGPGPHQPIVKKLEGKYCEKITYYDHMPRSKALKLISSCYFAYSPVKVGGWGFIGDCWSVKTPVVMTHNDDYIVNNTNALVSADCEGLTENINRLYKDTSLYKKLQSNGYMEYENRKATIVGDKLHSIFIQALNSQ